MARGVFQRITLEERFNKYINKKGPDECWEWTSAKDSSGYGHLWAGTGKSPIMVHRFSLELHLCRPIPPGMFVLHSCDNPACVNPNHLREGTKQDNSNDKMSRDRWSQGKGNRKLNWEKVSDIRSRVGQTQRALAAEFDVSESTISDILHRKTWTD